MNIEIKDDDALVMFLGDVKEYSVVCLGNNRAIVLGDVAKKIGSRLLDFVTFYGLTPQGLLNEQIAAEREACAKMAEVFADSPEDNEAGAALAIAAAIRERGP